MKRLVSTLLMIVLLLQTVVITSVASTTNGVEDFVTRCYQIALGRDPDSEGLKDWTNKLQTGEACGVSVAYGFVYSPEFQNAGFDNSTYVEKMYNMLLGRPSDEGGKKDWVSKLNSGTSKEEIFYGFANSQEFYNLCKEYGMYAGFYIYGSGMERNAAINGYVDRLYTICLDRHGDIGGQSDWVMHLAEGAKDGATVAYGFIFSPEYMNKKTSNEEYVEMLYSTFLGRTPDEGGYKDWVEKLDTGEYSREGVFNGFCNSQEFTNICGKYGIERGTANYADLTYTPKTQVTPTSAPTSTVAPTSNPTGTVAPTTTSSPTTTNNPTQVPTSTATPTPTEEPTPTPKYQVGDIVVMGTYDYGQDGTPEDIEWVVTDIQDGKALLVTRTVLDYGCYSNKVKPYQVTWNDSIIKTWLNSDFYNGSFSESEKKSIISNTFAGSESKVFILSPEETMNYMDVIYSDSFRIATQKLIDSYPRCKE